MMSCFIPGLDSLAPIFDQRTIELGQVRGAALSNQPNGPPLYAFSSISASPTVRRVQPSRKKKALPRIGKGSVVL